MGLTCVFLFAPTASSTEYAVGGLYAAAFRIEHPVLNNAVSFELFSMPLDPSLPLGPSVPFRVLSSASEHPRDVAFSSALVLPVAFSSSSPALCFAISLNSPASVSYNGTLMAGSLRVLLLRGLATARSFLSSGSCEAESGCRLLQALEPGKPRTAFSQEVDVVEGGLYFLTFAGDPSATRLLSDRVDCLLGSQQPSPNGLPEQCLNNNNNNNHRQGATACKVRLPLGGGVGSVVLETPPLQTPGELYQLRVTTGPRTDFYYLVIFGPVAAVLLLALCCFLALLLFAKAQFRSARRDPLAFAFPDSGQPLVSVLESSPLSPRPRGYSGPKQPSAASLCLERTPSFLTPDSNPT